jgi:hypothetical protein
MTTDNFCFYLQNRLIQTSQIGGQQYRDISPLSIPWFESNNSVIITLNFYLQKNVHFSTRGLKPNLRERKERKNYLIFVM